MHWLIAFPSLLAVAVLVALVPYQRLRLAYLNTQRSSGGTSEARARREMRHLGRFLRRTLLKPLLVLAAVQIPLLVHHHTLGVGHLLANLFGDHHPEVSITAIDTEAWSEIYRDQLQAGLTAPPRGAIEAASALLLHHWPLYPAFLILSTAFVFFFFTTRYSRWAREYSSGVILRRRQYRQKEQHIAELR